jgi:hypothetical protein
MRPNSGENNSMHVARVMSKNDPLKPIFARSNGPSCTSRRVVQLCASANRKHLHAHRPYKDRPLSSPTSLLYSGRSGYQLVALYCSI